MSETADSLKRRIATHYDICSQYYFDLWGDHIHHGYWISGEETKDEAQIQLIDLLINKVLLY
jgi:tocopherol O-methyltransferase